jgi:hypothetical protein
MTARRGPEPPAAPVVDPTHNVIRRQDDLRAADEKLAVERQINFRREVDLREDFARRFKEAEAGRINALLDLIRLEIKTGRESAGAMAETLRSTVESTRLALAGQVESYRKEIDARLSAIERNQAAGTGKGAGMNALWGYLVAGVMLLLALWSKVGK